MIATPETKSVTMEREMQHSPEIVWRALTVGDLIKEWLMHNDFEPVAGRKFKLTADWGSVDCEILSNETHKRLSYSWEAYDLASVVTWTLTPTISGTELRMVHSGFSASQSHYYEGAKSGWNNFFAALEKLLARIG